MISWLFFAILGQFLYAVTVLIDRHIVTQKVVGKPIIYAFYVSFLSLFALGAIPFGVTMASLHTLGLSVLVSITFVISITSLYEVLKKSNPSEVVPVVGGVAAISAFLSSAVLLGTGLPAHFLSAFIVLNVGMLLISHFKFTWRSFFLLSISGITFGLSSVLTKAIFADETFINGFFWSRMANVFVAILLLLIPGVWRSIKNDWGKPNKSSKTFFVLGNKVLGALGFLSVLFAIKHGDVAIVNALTATQYIFLLIFAIFFSKLLPEYFTEKIHRHEFLHKFSATMLIVVGFFLLFL